MAKKLTRKQKRARNKALFRLRSRRRNLKRACYGKAKTKRGRRRKLRSWKCRYHKKMLPRNKRAVKRAYRRKGRKATRRRSRRNPGQVTRRLRDGSTVVLAPVGSGAILRVFSPEGELITDRRVSWEAGMKALHKHKSGRRYAKRATASAWRMLAMDNPRRRLSWAQAAKRVLTTPRLRAAYKAGGLDMLPSGKAQAMVRLTHPKVRSFSKTKVRALAKLGFRFRRSRRNPAQFPTPFVSALNPRISRAEAKAMVAVLRRHKYGRRR